MENEIMKFEEVMEFLNIGKNTLYILLNSGEIQAFRIEIGRASCRERV